MRELSLHILDIVQNSIEAGASEVILEINEDPDSDLFEMIIRDNGRGMTPEMVQGVTDPFVTTRTTRKVGLGIPLFHSAAEQAGGDLVVDSEVGKGTTIRANFSYKHIDRAPLGDMVGTILALLGSNPRMELVYRHRYKDKEFEFRTEDIRETLEDIEISHPMILGWIRNHLQDGLAEIYGGERE